ncbi:MFS transporter [Nocardia niwae]|uniref:MFS transporter n=1 Tax=Nocardia niwae TaxID=626084 RepID=UPI0007A40C94|nr:MFS transporter [Nocardia niwae]
MSVLMDRLRISEKSLSWFLTARGVSVFGDGMTSAALAFAVLARGTAADLAAIIFARTFAMFLFALIGGSIGDRYSRIRVMVAADIVSASCVAVSAVLLMQDDLNLVALCVLYFIYGIALSFFRPSLGGIIPLLLVEQANLKAANAAHNFIYYLCITVGPAAGGVLATVLAPVDVLFIDCCTFLASALLLAGVRLRDVEPEEGPGSLWSGVVHGIKFVFATRWLLAMICVGAGAQFVSQGIVVTIGPAVLETVSGGKIVWAASISAAGIGALIGAPVAARLNLVNAYRTSCLASLLGVPPIVLLGVPALPIAIVVSFGVSGLAACVAETFRETLIQRVIPMGYLSRVSSVEWVVESSLRMLGIASAPVLWSILGTTALFVCSGVLLIVLLIGAALIEYSGFLEVPRLPAEA